MTKKHRNRFRDSDIVQTLHTKPVVQQTVQQANNPHNASDVTATPVLTQASALKPHSFLREYWPLAVVAICIAISLTYVWYLVLFPSQSAAFSVKVESVSADQIVVSEVGNDNHVIDPNGQAYANNHKSGDFYYFDFGKWNSHFEANHTYVLTVKGDKILVMYEWPLK
jgi:hypothetical protein